MSGRAIRPAPRLAPTSPLRRSRRVVLIDWDAEAVRTGVETLRRARYDARLVVAKAAPTCAGSRISPRNAARRALPLVFVGGVAEKVARTRALLPDATFTRGH